MTELINPIMPLGVKQTQMKVTPEMAKEMLSRGITCAWKDCESHYIGKLPPGWRMMAVFKDDTDYKSVFNGEIDGSICPTHVRELGKSLKVGYKLEVAAAEANRATN